MTINTSKEAKRKETSRQIVKTIIDYGVTDQQKIDIMYFLTATLENHNTVKEISKCLKKFKVNINIEKENTNIANNNKILT